LKVHENSPVYMGKSSAFRLQNIFHFVFPIKNT